MPSLNLYSNLSIRDRNLRDGRKYCYFVLLLFLHPSGKVMFKSHWWVEAVKLFGNRMNNSVLETKKEKRRKGKRLIMVL